MVNLAADTLEFHDSLSLDHIPQLITRCFPLLQLSVFSSLSGSSHHDNGEPIIGEKGVRPSSLGSFVPADIRPHSRLSCYSSLVVVESEVGRLR